jgi:hypothetical protein
MLGIFMNALARANPSDVDIKSMKVSGEAVAFFGVRASGRFGAPSKKNAAGT